MKTLFNKWLGYIDRTIEQAEAAILNKINTPEGIPEMTDHTSSNIFIKMIRIWTAILELIQSYLDHSAREAFPTVAQEFKSLVFFANLIGYRIRGTIAASVDQIFFIAAPALVDITIPAGTRVKSANNIVFITKVDGVIEAGETQVTVAAVNEIPFTGEEIGVGTGLKNQKFTIAVGVVDNSLTFTTGVNGWVAVDSLIASPGNHFAFVAGLNENGIMMAKTGDGLNGAMPPSGMPLIATYKTSSGSLGNLPAKTITVIDSAVTVPSGVVLQTINNTPSVGGVDQEDLESLRRNSINFLHTQERAVRLPDYEKIAELAPGVAKAKAIYLNKRKVDIYIAPAGSTTGIATSGLIDSTEAYMATRRLVGKQIVVSSAGVIKIKIEAKLYLKDGYLKTPKIAEAEAILADFLSIANQEIEGSVGLGDLYQLLEGIEGVKLTHLDLVLPVPYARPLGHEVQLDWTRQIKSASVAAIKWKLFVNDAGTFKVLRNNSYIGIFNFGDVVDLSEIQMTITNTGYATNASWEFYTYPYNTGSVELQEPSIPVADVSDITITAIGGI
jgi:uncharacterized phage protein gp47/JayE